MNQVTKIKRAFILFAAVLFVTGAAINAQTFNATVRSTTIGVNEPFQVSFEFNGEDVNSIKGFRAPDFPGFRVLSGPNQSTSMQIINGAVSASVSFSYYLQAIQTGTISIGPAALDYKGKTYRTQPVRLTVVKGSAQHSSSQKNEPSSQNISENVFIRAVADKQKVLKGEQVMVTYKLYTRMDISSPQISKLPSYQGFWAEELETANRINFTTEVINGKQFHVGVLKRAALFPTQTGELSVTPFELVIPVVVPKARKRGDIFDEFFNDPFFNQGQTVEYKAVSNTLKINVLPLPSENVPLSFNGAVGNFDFKASIDREKVKTNEPFTLKLTVSGTGNINLLDLPEVNLPAGFEKYEPKIDQQISKSGTISGRKTVEYIIVPRIPGQKEIPPVEFSFFNPQSKRYVTFKSQAFSLNIEKGDGSYDQNYASYNKEDVKLLGEDIRFIKTDIGGLSKQGSYTVYSPLFWSASILPLIALAGMIVWKRKNDRLSGNMQMMRYQRAEKMARNRLKSAHKSLEADNQQAFYSDISLALFGYLEDKLHIPKSDFTIDGVVEQLNKKDVEPELTANVRQTLEQCEFARFAPLSDAPLAMREMYERTVSIIVELEKSFMGKAKVKVS